MRTHLTKAAGARVVPTVPRRRFPGGSLPNGRYRLIVRSDRVHDRAGRALDGDADGQPGGHRTVSFRRRFGDTDGDGDFNRRDRKLLAMKPGFIREAAQRTKSRRREAPFSAHHPSISSRYNLPKWSVVILRRNGAASTVTR